MDVLQIIGRSNELFHGDIISLEQELNDIISGSNILIIGAAGSIGQAVSIELFKRQPASLHVVDLNENNLVELVRTIRSTIGYNSCDFKTFALDCGSDEFDAFCASSVNFNYVFNLSAMKHVISESDPFSLMRMINVNIFNTVKTVRMSAAKSSKNYFCVSTDKAANPVNMMGASKRIMEKFLMRESKYQNISMARFANVAFSDGSLLHGFNQRFAKRQPISAPNDVKRYFVTPKESGQLCMMAGLFGRNREIYFPKLKENLHLENFSNIAVRFLSDLGFEAFQCETEEEARARTHELIPRKKWPVYFFESDTTGEKGFEEFFMSGETLNMTQYEGIGIVENDGQFENEKLERFSSAIEQIKLRGIWSKAELVDLFCEILPEFSHTEKGKYLDDRM